ncbi:MAG TPA: family 10 glycosylhydrolase [Verrucomicrobiae bacterium]|nr:family 10 glycosylhydrolase [Verrucomicrobiae bacterium]
MKVAASLFLLLLSATFLAAAETYQPVSGVPPTPPREFRGAWIATVGNKDWPSAPGLSVARQKAEMDSLLDTAVRLKLNAVVFQVRPASDALYASAIEPWSEYLTGVQGRAPQPYYDPLAFAVEEAHRRGLELHAWFNPFRARVSPLSPPAPNSVSRAHPGWVRKYGDQLWLDPGDPAVRDYVIRVIVDVVRRYDLDGVQFDDYFYPYPVNSERGTPVPFPDDATWRAFGEHSRLSREDWRRQNIDEFIESVHQNIKAAKPWVKFGVSPFGIWQPGYPAQVRGFNPYAELYADSRLWLANGWVDYLAPQLYWPINSPAQGFQALLSWWEAQNLKGRNLWPGLAAYMAGTKFPVTEIGRQIEATRAQRGASGEIFFEMRSFQQNPALATVVASQYAETALVPASPWLQRAALGRPNLMASFGGGDIRIQWSLPGGSPPARWLLQVCGPDSVWKTAVLPGYQTALSLPFAPQLISIRAVDGAENLGPAAVIGKNAGQPKPTAELARPVVPSRIAAPARSFWGSFPKN